MRATKNKSGLNGVIISRGKNNLIWDRDFRIDAFEKVVINDPWIVKILGWKKDKCRSLKERERERERWSLMVGEEKIGKVGLKVVLDVVPSAKLMRGKRTGTRPPVWWISSERVLIEIYFFPPPPAFITNATVIANSGFDRSNYFSSSVRALIACFMAGVSHLSSNRSPDKRSDYRRFDSNEGLKYRLINSMLVKNWREFVPRAGVSPWNFSGSRERLWNWCKTRSGLKKKNKIACAYWWKHSYANVFREEISDM